jgi:hypothetical protein
MNDIAFSMAAPLPGPAPEVSVSNDMVKRGLLVAPLLIAVCGLIWGANGAASSAYAIAIVLVNFALAAAIVAVTAKISLRLMMASIMFGYLVRPSTWSKTPDGFRCRHSERPSSSPTWVSSYGSSSTWRSRSPIRASSPPPSPSLVLPATQ